MSSSPGPVDTRLVDLAALALFLLVGCSIAAAITIGHFFHIDLLGRLPRPVPGRAYVGWGLLLLATATALLNAWLSLLSPWLHRRAHGNLTGFDGPSGLPVIGNLLCGLAAVLIPPSQTAGIWLTLVYLGDAGGLPCFAGVVGREWWRDRRRRALRSNDRRM